MTSSARHLPSGIRFNDCIFSEPFRFADWIPPGCPGLFAILAFDPNWAPKPLRPIYFGEFGNNAPAQQLMRDVNRALHGSSRNLLIAVLPMPFTTTAQRCALRDEMAGAYNPACQINGNAPGGELGHNTGELERKHHEQNMQVSMLAAEIGRFYEPPPSRPRHRIGFNPLCEPAT